jgi:hypothetical protein
MGIHEVSASRVHSTLRTEDCAVAGAARPPAGCGRLAARLLLGPRSRTPAEWNPGGPPLALCAIQTGTGHKARRSPPRKLLILIFRYYPSRLPRCGIHAVACTDLGVMDRNHLHVMDCNHLRPARVSQVRPRAGAGGLAASGIIWAQEVRARSRC